MSHGMPTPTIARVRPLVTAPDGIPLVVVKVETSEPGLYGLGCATFTQRAAAVAAVVETYLDPWARGRPVHAIEDLWHAAMVSAYWRNGPITNAAVSGLDMALWDIKGKLAGMPCYMLWGGASRSAVAVYRHADGRDPEEIGDRVAAWMEAGVRYVRCQWGGYGGAPPAASARGVPLGAYFDPAAYRRAIPRLFERLRERFGDTVELLHDVHERLAPPQAIRLAKDLAPYDLFFLEDVLPPEQIGWFRLIRQQSTVPLAMGELFTHPLEWQPLLAERLVDFVRVHLSQIGGVTPALKLAHVAEAFGVRTAWHGPGDVSPVGHAANVHLDVHLANFGIQEWAGWSESTAAVFPGAPQVEAGYIYPSDRPGWGIDIDEAEAAKYPPHWENPRWTEARLPDGTVTWP
jgi:mannonate dehydratase